MKYNLEQAFARLDEIKDESNVVLVKFDGQRTENKITVVISMGVSVEETIQYHGSDLVLLLNKAIEHYYDIKNETT